MAKKKKRGRKAKKASTNFGVIITIIFSFLLAGLIYTESGYVGIVLSDFFGGMLGMIKYVCKSKDGKFDLNSSACFLGITNNMVETLLELFEDCKSINITERTEDYFIIKFIKQISTENLKNSENYNVFVEQLSNSIELRKHYLECDINELTTI